MSFAGAPVVTVVVPTRDRSARLSTCLAGVLASLAGWGDSWELLVVDNGSTDATREVVERLASAEPRVRYVSEPAPGACRARNRAFDVARGDVVLFADDDIEVTPGWVGDMVAPVLDGTADAVAGRIRVADHLRKPWMTPTLLLHFGETLETTPPWVVAASFAVRREVATTIRFDEELGPGRLGFGDDDLLTRQLLEAGHRLVRCEGPPATHSFDPSRLTRVALLHKAEASGRSVAYISHHWSHTARRTFALRALKHMAEIALYRARNRPGPDQPITERELSLAVEVAFNRQMLRERRRPRNYARRGRTKLR